MNRKKLEKFLFIIGMALIVAGILSGVAVGFFTGDGFNLVPAVVIWLLTVISGTGFVTISGSLGEAGEKKQSDEEALREIIEKIRNESNPNSKT